MRIGKISESQAVRFCATAGTDEHIDIACALSAQELRWVFGGVREKVHLPLYDSLAVQPRADRSGAALSKAAGTFSEN